MWYGMWLRIERGETSWKMEKFEKKKKHQKLILKKFNFFFVILLLKLKKIRYKFFIIKQCGSKIWNREHLLIVK